MAQDQVEVMQRLGFTEFAVVGHDRGARVAQKPAPHQNDPKKRIPIAITNAEIPANKNADDSACL